MCDAFEEATELPARYALLITTEINGTAADRRAFCRKYEETLALALGRLPLFFWLTCGRVLGVFHVFESLEAIEEYLSSRPIQTLACESSVNRSVFIQQFDVVDFGQVAQLASWSANEQMASSVPLSNADRFTAVCGASALTAAG